VLSDARQLIGDLAVETFVLDREPRPPHPRNPRQRLQLWYGYAERWLQLAIAAGVAGEESLHELTLDAVRPLAVAFDTSPLVRDLRDAFADGFNGCCRRPRHGYDARTRPELREPWRQLCMMRSALEFVRGFLDSIPRYRADLDMARVDEPLRSAFAVLPKLDVPVGIPTWHWWWY
jgi:hypothetical protein